MCLPILWAQVQPYWGQPDRFAGVFEYEVVPTLGENLAGHMLDNDGSLPAEREFEQIARELIKSFFGGGKARIQRQDEAVNGTSGLRRIMEFYRRLFP